MDRNIRRLDISNPLQAYQFILFLLRLRFKEGEFREKTVNKHVREKLRDNLAAGTFKKWAKDHLDYPKTEPESEGSSVGSSTLPTVPEDHLEHAESQDDKTAVSERTSNDSNVDSLGSQMATLDVKGGIEGKRGRKGKGKSRK